MKAALKRIFGGAISDNNSCSVVKSEPVFDCVDGGPDCEVLCILYTRP